MTSGFYIGITAACLFMSGFIHQTARMYTTRSVADMSITTLSQFTLGVSLRAVHSVSVRNPIRISAHIVSPLTLAVAPGLYFSYPHIQCAPGMAREGGPIPMIFFHGAGAGVAAMSDTRLGTTL
jgi:hypothetical protein